MENENVEKQISDSDHEITLFEEESLEKETPDEVVAENEKVDEEVQPGPSKILYQDTNNILNTELKQLIMKKVADEIAAKSLRDRTNLMEQQMSDMNSKMAQVAETNKNLKIQVEADMNLMTESKDCISKTNQMVTLLNESVQKLEKRVKEKSAHVQLLREKATAQHEKFEALINHYNPKIRSVQERIKNLKAHDAEKKSLVMADLNHRREALKNLKQKCEEIENLNIFHDEEIGKLIARKDELKQKLAHFDEASAIRRSNKEEELAKQIECLEKLQEAEKEHAERMDYLKGKKDEVEKISQERSKEVERLQGEISNLIRENRESEECLKQLKSEAEKVQKESKERTDLLFKRRDEVEDELERKTNEVAANEKHTAKQLDELNMLKAQYVEKCQEKSDLLNKIINQKNVEHKNHMNFLDKKIEYVERKTKVDSLQERHDELANSIKAIDDEISMVQQTSHEELSAETSRLEELSVKHAKYLDELNKKKDYAVATSDYLKKKVESLQEQFTKSERSYEDDVAENSSLKTLIESKQKRLDELKRQLDELKAQDPEQQKPAKSGLKSPGKGSKNAKKVKFNDTLFFKAATESSEISSQPIPAKDRSFEELLEHLKAQTSPKDTPESEEF